MDFTAQPVSSDTQITLLAVLFTEAENIQVGKDLTDHAAQPSPVPDVHFEVMGVLSEPHVGDGRVRQKKVLVPSGSSINPQECTRPCAWPFTNSSFKSL
jgi:hypothetical protein